MSTPTKGKRLTSRNSQTALFIAALFLFVLFGSATFIVDSVIYPLWVMMVANVQAFLKLLTPANFLAFIKQGSIGAAKKKAMGVAPEVVIDGYAPWRRKVNAFKEAIMSKFVTVVAMYRKQGLVGQVGVAAALLTLGVSSGYTLLAILIIPQPVINFVKLQIVALLQKTGILQVCEVLITKLLPYKIRYRYLIFFKWKIGRKKVLLSRRIHAKMRSHIKELPK